jgi:hypothetical protein
MIGIAMFFRSSTTVTYDARSITGFDAADEYFPMIRQTTPNEFAADMDLWAVNRFRSKSTSFSAILIAEPPVRWTKFSGWRSQRWTKTAGIQSGGQVISTYAFRLENHWFTDITLDTALNITKGSSKGILDIGWTNFHRDTELRHHVRLEGFDAAKIRVPASMGLGDIEEFMSAVDRGECRFRKMEPEEVFAYRQELDKRGIQVNARKKQADSGKKRVAAPSTKVKVAKKAIATTSGSLVLATSTWQVKVLDKYLSEHWLGGEDPENWS